MAMNRAKISTAFEIFGAWVFQHRLKVIAALILVFAGFVSQLPKTRFDTTNESFFRKNDPILLDYDALRDQFGREEVVVLGISGKNIFEEKFLRRLIELHDALETELPYVDEVTSLANVRDTRGEGDTLIVEDLLENFPVTDEALAELRPVALFPIRCKNELDGLV